MAEKKSIKKKPKKPNAGHKNLTPFSKDDNRASEAGKIGGVVAGVSKRRIKSFKESLKALLYTELTPKQKTMYQKMGYKVEENEVTTHMDLAGARCLAKVIATGDQKAMKDLAEMAGEHMNENKLIVEGDLGNLRPVINLTLGERPKMIPGEQKEDKS